MDELTRESLMLAGAAGAHAEGALERTIEYVTTRKAFGQPVSSFQNTRFELAKIKMDIEVNRAFYEKCCRLYAIGQLDVPTAAKIGRASCRERVCQYV